jgi:hypothetical protein
VLASATVEQDNPAPIIGGHWLKLTLTPARSGVMVTLKDDGRIDQTVMAGDGNLGFKLQRG